MEKFARGFFSIRMMAVGMLVFLLSIGFATFIETKFDTQSSKLVVYNAMWFELLLVYLAMSLIANIFRYKMFRPEKIAILFFHLSFIVMLIGAGVTRYVSFEGLMVVKEGQESNFIYSSDPYFWMKVNDGKMQYTWDQKAFMTEISDFYNDFDHEFELPGHAPITVEYAGYRKNYMDSLVTKKSFKETSLEIVTGGMKSNFVTEGSFLMVGEVAISFDKKDAMPGIQITRNGAKLMMQSKFPITYLAMSKVQKAARTGGVADSLYQNIPVDSLVPFETATLYKVGEQQFVLKSVRKHSKMMMVKAPEKNMGRDILTVKVIDGNESKLVDLRGGEDAIPTRAVFEFKGLIYEMDYGSKEIVVPFSVYCKDFKLDRYPGSNSPSSFESFITIIDKKNNYKKNTSIYMNNVIDYKGYRLFQSGYEQDESGTHLSVNHDWWGTNLSYLGYLMMGIGMVLSLFSKHGRFRELNVLMKKTNNKLEKMWLPVIALLVSTSMSLATQDSTANASNLDTVSHTEHHDHDGHDHEGHDHSDPNHKHEEAQVPMKNMAFNVMTEEHSEEFARLLVQDFRGRIIPMHTLCSQLLRKIHRDDTYGEYNAVQAIISMHIYWDYWKNEKMIFISRKGGIREKLKLEGKYASYDQLLDEEGEFIYWKEYNKSHQASEADRNEFQKKVLLLGEKFQILQTIYSFKWGNLKILPIKDDKNETWTPIGMSDKDPEGFNTAVAYFNALNDAYSNQGGYKLASEKLDDLKKYQRKFGANVVPSEDVVELEIRYNKMKIFETVTNYYLYLGLLILIIFYVKVFIRRTAKAKKVFKMIGLVLIGLTTIAFLYHGYGIYMRMMITGEAPWSNGFEAIVFISWVTVLTSLIFARKNIAILAGGTIMAFFMLWVANMNLLDPEITPLQPVLKSYWLMIHVAIITASYAPLGLSCMLGLMNLVLYIFRGKKNGKVIGLEIAEIRYMAEITMIIGLFMLTIGTFLGGIWANESWGRYWGWDPKETWALVAVLVYAVILHLRYIPALKDKFTFSVLSFWGYASILFTFFGVNFYLVGLHSYANGDGLGEFPSWLISTMVAFYVFTEIASVQNQLYIAKGKVAASYFKKKIALIVGFVLFTSFMLWILSVTEFSAMVIPLLQILGLIALMNALQYGYVSLRRNSNTSTEIDEI
jgi:cytochrome c-type biogenesis protein CcsB